MKKAQVTIFVILAMAIVFTFFFFIYLRTSISEIKIQTDTKKSFSRTYDITPVKDFTGKCVQRTIEKALFDRIGFQGGYINSTGSSKYNDSGAPLTLTYNNYEVPYYLENDINTSLSIEQIQAKLNKFTAIEIETCLNYSVFPQFNTSKPLIDYNAVGFNFSSVETDFNSSINSEDISMTIIYPLELKKRDFTSAIKEFQSRVYVPLGFVYETAQNLVKELETQPPGLEYNLTDNCAILIPDGCPSEKISRIYTFPVGADSEPQDYTIIIESDNIPYKQNFNFQFAVNLRRIIEECSC